MRMRWTALGLLLLSATIGGAAIAGDDGFVSDAFLAERARAYLEYATEANADSILNAIAHMERDQVDAGYDAPQGALDVGAFARSFEKFEKLLDTRDFDGLYLLNAVLGYEDHPYLTPALWDAMREALLSFKYWFTDPTPPMPDPDLPERDWDETFYWTENHQILFHTLEYLAGQRFPEECFWIAGLARSKDCSAEGEMTGAAHQARARELILRWLDERWELGFSEWHSNIYYQKDATPLLSLVEYADDEEIRTRAAILLDVLLLDLATHTHRSVLGVTHGRSEMKDTHQGSRNDTWGIVLLLFAQQDEHGYASRGDAGATLFARAKRYRMPQLILEAANDPRPFVARERIGVEIDERGPLIEDPPHPPGHSFDDTPENFTFWWGIGAWTAWQVVPLTIANAERYNLWPIELLAPFEPLLDVLGRPPPVGVSQTLAASGWPALSLGLLKEVNTYTYRNADYILSTAQDYRPGANAGQVHSWQATFDHDAMVFTTHPMNAQQPPSEWIGRTDGQPGYWSGTASQPRSAQHENVAIHLYSPRYPDGGLLGALDFEALTHAYFPRDAFDEWSQQAGWTFGRAHDAYVALYSWRDTAWADYPPDELALLPPTRNGPFTQSFDLVAEGGPDNVWIVECGRAADWPSLDAFREAILAASVIVTPREGPPSELGAEFPVFDVLYDSPSLGVVSFGWDAPLFVAGEQVPLGDYPRIANPWVDAERGAAQITMQGEASRAVLDWALGTRNVSALPEPSAIAIGLAALATLSWLRSARPDRPQ